MPYANKDAQRAFQREWKNRRRAEWLCGRTCAFCGAAEGLEVDHIDPLQKVDHRIWSWSDEHRLAELAKCRAVCRACHNMRHGNVAHHGTFARYAKRCRCEECLAAAKREWARRRSLRLAG